jgi:hypothetical protein
MGSSDKTAELTRAPRSGVERLREDLAQHRELIGEKNAQYVRALTILDELLFGPGADTSIVTRLERAWGDRTFDIFYERPLLLLAALRCEALTDPGHPLARGFAIDAPRNDAITREALADALGPHRLGLWVTLRARKVQTNEVSRAVVWRWPAAIADLGSRLKPLALVDIGASGGLNLVADRLQQRWIDLEGRPIPIAAAPKIVARIGYDTDPLDMLSSDDAAWARACLWPGETERHEQLARAIRALGDLRDTPGAVALHREPATLVPLRLGRLAASLPSGAVVLAYQSFLRDYIEPWRRAQYIAGMLAWLSASPPGSAYWAEIELAASSGPRPAEIVVHARLKSGVATFAIGRSSYHPQSVELLPGAGEFARAIGRQ